MRHAKSASIGPFGRRGQPDRPCIQPPLRLPRRWRRPTPADCAPPENGGPMDGLPLQKSKIPRRRACNANFAETSCLLADREKRGGRKNAQSNRRGFRPSRQKRRPPTCAMPSPTLRGRSADSRRKNRRRRPLAARARNRCPSLLCPAYAFSALRGSPSQPIRTTSFACG